MRRRRCNSIASSAQPCQTPRSASPARSGKLIAALGGIIRNEHDRLELLAIADALLSTRLRQRDLSLAGLVDELERLMAVDDDPADHIIRLVDRALESDPEIDFRFFARAAVSRLAELGLSAAKRLFEHLSRRIAARFHAPPRRRQRLLGDLSEALLVAG